MGTKRGRVKGGTGEDGDGEGRVRRLGHLFICRALFYRFQDIEWVPNALKRSERKHLGELHSLTIPSLSLIPFPSLVTHYSWSLWLGEVMASQLTLSHALALGINAFVEPGQGLISW